MTTGNKLKIVFAWHKAVSPERRLLFKELAALGHEVTVIAPEAWNVDGADEHAYTMEEDGYRLLGLPAAYKNKPDRFFYLDVIALVLTLRMSRPDIVHVFEQPHSPAAFELTLLSRLFSPRARLVIETADESPAPQGRRYSYFSRYTLGRCAVLLFAKGSGKGAGRSERFAMPVGQTDGAQSPDKWKAAAASLVRVYEAL